MTVKITWVKTGGHETSRTIVYEADRGGFQIIRNRIGGQWTIPTLYRDGKFVLGFATVQHAKDHAQHILSRRW